MQGTAAEWALCWLADLRRRLRDLGEVGGVRPVLVYFLHDEIMVHTPVELADEVAALVRAGAAEAGRKLQDFTLAYKLFLNIGEAKQGPFDAREPGTGSVAEITDDLKRLFELGFTKIIVRYRGDSAAELTRQIDRFVDEIVPKV